MLKRIGSASLITAVVLGSYCLVAIVVYFEFFWISVIRENWPVLNRLDVMIHAGFFVAAGVPLALLFAISPIFILKKWAGRNREHPLSI